MRYGIVENGTLVNVVEADTPDSIPGLVPIGDGDCIGWRYGNGTFAAPPDLVKSPEQIITELESAVQSHLNASAKTHGYDDIKSAALRAGYLGPFQAEGIAYATWMDGCWAHCYQVLAAVQAGTRAIPTAVDLIAELPVLVLP